MHSIRHLVAVVRDLLVEKITSLNCHSFLHWELLVSLPNINRQIVSISSTHCFSNYFMVQFHFHEILKVRISLSAIQISREINFIYSGGVLPLDYCLHLSNFHDTIFGRVFFRYMLFLLVWGNRFVSCRWKIPSVFYLKKIQKTMALWNFTHSILTIVHTRLSLVVL